MEELGVVPLEGGVALLELLEEGRLELEGVTPLGGVTGGEAESRKCGFFGGRSGGKTVDFLVTLLLVEESWRHFWRLSRMGVEPPFLLLLAVLNN